MEQYITTIIELEELISKNRFTVVLVRYRGESEGRFTTSAQYVPDLINILTGSGRYVRDMSYKELE